MQIRKIWEIDELFCCPLVGICLTMAQQQQILKRCGIKVKVEQDYVVHATLIENVRKDSPVAKRLEKLFNRKYRKEITEWQTIFAA
jgi:2'-5' RNA ligase